MIKPIRSSRKTKEHGATIILFTFVTVLVLIPIIGLAIDGSIVMWEKARLSSSVDAAAYAAGRSLNLGNTTTTAKNAAAATALTYFNANFQPGTMRTSVSQFSPATGSQLPDPVSGTWTIPVSATVNVPLYFLRLLGFNNASLSATAQTTRKNVNIILVLDRSASLQLYDNNASCNAMKASAQNFTNMFAPGQDNLGLITFQTTAKIDFWYGTDFKTRSVPEYGVQGVSQLIGQIQCLGYTNTVSALKLAYSQIVTINQPLAQNVIVFFSDGRPDAITATFNVKSAADIRDDPSPNTPDRSSPASQCRSGNSMSGVLVAFDEYPDRAASTLGILPNSTSLINSTLPSGLGNQPPYYGLFPYPIIDNSNTAQGCTFSPSNNQSVSIGYISGTSHSVYYCTGSSCDVRKDVDVVPSTDAYGNATNTTYRPISSPDGLFSSGAYRNKIRPDTAAGVVNASTNAAYEQVKAIRTGAYKPIIYSIGLGQYIDDDFMKDVANDPLALNYDPNSPAGQYVKAPTSAQLSSAFQQIASQVLRISR